MSKGKGNNLQAVSLPLPSGHPHNLCEYVAASY